MYMGACICVYVYVYACVCKCVYVGSYMRVSYRYSLRRICSHENNN